MPDERTKVTSPQAPLAAAGNTPAEKRAEAPGQAISDVAATDSHSIQADFQSKVELQEKTAEILFPNGDSIAHIAEASAASHAAEASAKTAQGNQGLSTEAMDLGFPATQPITVSSVTPAGQATEQSDKRSQNR